MLCAAPLSRVSKLTLPEALRVGLALTDLAKSKRQGLNHLHPTNEDSNKSEASPNSPS